MRRLSKHFGALVLALVVGAILTICSLATFAHSSEVNSSSSKASCNSSCSSHGQPPAINSLEDEQENDDKEPTPPLLYWQQFPISLSALYIAPIVLYFFAGKRKVVLLTMQLRF